MATKTTRKVEIEKKILAFCKTFKSLGEISGKLDMNKNTVRAGYLYPMSRGGRLIRSAEPPIRNTMKYRAAPKK